ncbi:MAG: DsrE family protein [Sphingomonas sp.]
MPPIASLFLPVALLAAPATAAPQATPVIAGHGAIHPVPNAANRPDPGLDYKVVFSVTTAAPAPDKANPGLEKVARLLNLLGDGGVPAGHRHVVPIVHGAATLLVLSGKAYGARFNGAANPDADLLAKLKAAGAPVHVCAQALAGFGIADDQVDPNVVIDDSALTTMATLQLKGYALIAD